MCITSTLQTASDVFCEKKKIAQETYIPYPFSLGDLPTLDYLRTLLRISAKDNILAPDSLTP